MRICEQYCARQITAIALLGLGVATASAQAPPVLPETDRLPADTSVYLYRAGGAPLRQQLKGTAAGKLLESAAAGQFIDSARRPARSTKAGGHLFEFLFDGMHEEFMLSAREQSAPDSMPPILTVARSTPTTERRAHFDDLFRRLKESSAAQPSEPGSSGDVYTIAGRAPLYLSWDCATALLGNDRAGLQAASSAPAGVALANSPVFRSAIDPLYVGIESSKTPIALYYYDFRNWWTRIDTQPGAEGWAKSSWRSLQSVSGATFVEGQGFRNRHYWKLGDARRGLFQHTQTSRINQEWLKRIPADATGVTTGVWDPTGFVPTLYAFIGPLFSPDPLLVYSAYSYAARLEPLTANMGNRYLVYRLPTRYNAGIAGSVLPNGSLVAFLELTDQAGFLAKLDETGAQSGGWVSVFPSTWNGAQVRVFDVFYVSICIAVIDNVAIVTINRQLLKDAIEFYQKPGPSIVETPAFRTAQSRLLPDACFMMYFPPGGFARGIYDEYIPTAQNFIAMTSAMLRGQGLYRRSDQAARVGEASFDPLAIPRGRELVEGIAEPTILSARDDGSGILFDGTAPLLSTPYYWVYVHSLLSLNSTGTTTGIWDVLAWCVAQ